MDAHGGAFVDSSREAAFGSGLGGSVCDCRGALERARGSTAASPRCQGVLQDEQETLLAASGDAFQARTAHKNKLTCVL